MSLPSHIFFKNNDQKQNDRQTIGESPAELRFRSAKSEYIRDDSMNESQLYEKESVSVLTIVFYVLIVLAIIAIGVYGYKSYLGRPSNPDSEIIVADIITNSILNQLKEKQQLIIDEQYKELKQFYGKNFNQGIWNKIQDKIANSPGVLISTDKKKWFLE